MAAQVDPAAGVVRADGRVWPFEVDPATGTARVEVDGRSLGLRPLSWREKRNLAHFAPAGPELLERMLLQASLGSIPWAEASTAEREGLLALSLWLNAPGETFLPLESRLLAQVGVQVAQQLHCSPVDLASWPAHEVETTWQAVRGGLAPDPEDALAAQEPRVAAGPEDEGLSRILIVPDGPLPEVPGTSVGGRGGPEVVAAGSGPLPEVAGTSVGGGDLPGGADSVVSLLPTLRSHFRSPLPRQGERARVRGIPEETATGELRGAVANPPHPNPLPPAGGEGTGGCRRLPPQRVGTRGGGELAPMGDLPEVPGTSAASSRRHPDRRGGISPPGRRGGGPSAPLGATLPGSPEMAGTSGTGKATLPGSPEMAGTSGTLGSAEDPDAALAALIASMPGFEDAAAWPGASSASGALAGPAASPGEDLEELFDQFAERLEEAALDQGIDLEA